MDITKCSIKDSFIIDGKKKWQTNVLPLSERAIIFNVKQIVIAQLLQKRGLLINIHIVHGLKRVNGMQFILFRQKRYNLH